MINLDEQFIPSEDIQETEDIQEIENNLEPEVEITYKDTTPWIFFDYSGTLVDTANALSKAYTRFLGKDFPPEQVKSLFKDYPTMGKVALIRKYKFNPFKFLFGGSAKLEEIRTEEFLSGVRAFPGIPEALTRLQRIAKAKLGIVTHEIELEDEEKRQEFFERFGIPIAFDKIITDAKNKEIKFDEFITEQEIQHAILISDTQFDIDIGKKYNFSTVGVTWGFSTRDELQADYLINDPRELLQIAMSLLRQIEQKILHGDPI
ncbi:MAG: HAD family hydrolase [Asgard group archaeon]|nr:HAD family hydrolase [Asgard group archaeon]